MLFISGINIDATEEQIHNLFCEEYSIKNIHANLDRLTGLLKGYAILEFEHYKEALEVIYKFNGKIFMGQKLLIDFAFKKKPN